jgi:hypothetical protein
MKKVLILSILTISSLAFANPDLTHPQKLSEETVSAVLDVSNGPFDCRDKGPNFNNDGIIPGSLYLPNRGGLYGQDRVRAGDRASRIDYFGMTLPDSMTCKDVEARLPKTNGWVNITRRVDGVLKQTWKGGQTYLLLTETVQVHLADDIVLEGTSDWIDFIVPTDAIDPSRDIISQIIDHQDWQTQIDAKISVLSGDLKCERTHTVENKFQLLVNVGIESTNTRAVGRVFDTKEECTDHLSELYVKLNASSLTGANEVWVSRELSLVARPDFGDQGKVRVDQVRQELISLNIAGERFVGLSVMPLWQSSH